MTKSKVVGLGLIALCTGACAPYVPEPLDPAREYEDIAARSGAPLAAPAQVAAPKRLFPLSEHVTLQDGITLGEANALGLFYSPRLVTARGQFRLRGAELLRAGLLPNPQLFLGPRFSTTDGTLIMPGSLSVRVPLGGGLEAEEEQASARIRQARLSLAAQELEVLVEVRRAFIGLAALDRRIKLLRDALAASEEATRRIEARVRMGEADEVARGLAELDREQARGRLQEAESAVARARVQLLPLIGVLPREELRIMAEPTLLTPFAVPPADRERLLAHPRLRALEAAYRAAEQGVRIQVAGQYPTLRLGPEYEVDDGVHGIGIGIGVTLPIFDSNAGAIAVAKEQRTLGRTAWQNTLVRLAGLEAAARARHANATRRLETLRRRALPAATMTLRALATREHQGQSTLVEALATRQAATQVRLQEIALVERVATAGLDVLQHSGHLYEPKSSRPATDGVPEEMP